MGELILANEATGEEMTLNMGPQHPSTHGVIRFIIKTDGEIMREAVPDVGYLHRAIEHIAEKCTYEGFMPYTDRVDYVCAMPANHAWALAVEFEHYAQNAVSGRMLRTHVEGHLFARRFVGENELAHHFLSQIGKSSSVLARVVGMPLYDGAST